MNFYELKENVVKSFQKQFNMMRYCPRKIVVNAYLSLKDQTDRLYPEAPEKYSDTVSTQKMFVSSKPIERNSNQDKSIHRLFEDKKKNSKFENIVNKKISRHQISKKHSISI